jgi:radical SAM protein with 4Fe4S-binding SPASM domain
MFRKIDENLHGIVKNKFLNRRTSMEIIINEKCQNNCKYCYRTYKHNRSSIFSVEPTIVENLMNNFLDLFNLTKEEFFKHRHIELYGGEPLLDYKHSMDIFRVVDKFKPKYISIPTNARLVSELSEYDVDRLLGSIETKIHLSLSVDGIPNEMNRPLSKIGKMLAYDDVINYEKLFKLAKKHGCGFHPMLPFDSISRWFDTVKFFFDSFGIVPYLLEIRHSLSKEDSIEAVVQLCKIRNFYEKLGDKAVGLANTIKASIVPRGLGCSALTALTIMPNGDMPFCHRVIDPPWVYGNVFHGVDISKMISLTSVYDHRNVPDCFVCPIREYCSGQCAGSCYEYWGSPWIPIPSVCDYMRLKHYIFSMKYNDWKQMTDKKVMSRLKDLCVNKFGENSIKYILENTL